MNARFHLLLLAVALAVACEPLIDSSSERSPTAVPPQVLVGPWVRVDDAMEGMVIEMKIGPEGQLEGQVIHANDYALSFGYRRGDTKVRSLRPQGRAWLAECMNTTVDRWGRRTGEAWQTYVAYTRGPGTYPNELVLRQLKGRDLPTGEWQRWLRIEDVEKSVPDYHFGKGILLAAEGKTREALVEYEAALKLAPERADVINSVAWTLATSRESDSRAAARAIELASRACELSIGHPDYPHYLDTLAAAHARAGNYIQASRLQRQAIELAGVPLSEFLPEMRGRLALFEAERTYDE